MTITSRRVLHAWRTPLGLLADRSTIEHWSDRCSKGVLTGQLVAHARRHDGPDDLGADGDLSIRARLGHNGVREHRPDRTEGANAGPPDAPTIPTDQRRR